MVKTSLLWLSLTLLIVGSATAGNWHIAGSLKCGDCHLQHASSQLEAPTGAFSFMLKRNSVNELCLSCHDGSDPTAPDILQPITMYNGTVSLESGAGHFASAGIDNPNGHTLGIPFVTPLQGVATTIELNCANCHAVHGNGNYRNLEHDPAKLGADIQVIEGVDVMVLQSPSDPPVAGVSSLAYERDNSAYITDQMSIWCASCHDQLSNNATGVLPAHFNGHPNNVALNEQAIDSHADALHWVNGTGEGFTPGTGDGIARIPYLSPMASSYQTARIPRASDKVGCISCHKGHGSVNQRGMVWPYFEGGATSLAGCQQCHNK